jgi:hypothetical protein
VSAFRTIRALLLVLTRQLTNTMSFYIHFDIALHTGRSTGAVAELFDISCIPETNFNSLTDAAWAAWKAAPSSLTAQDVIDDLGIFNPPFVLGQHYFIVNPITGSGLSPKWDFTSASEAGHPDAYVVGARTGDVPAPTNPQTNIDWLSLNGVQGDLANQIYRIQTRGGQPPTSVSLVQP